MDLVKDYLNHYAYTSTLKALSLASCDGSKEGTTSEVQRQSSSPYRRKMTLDAGNNAEPQKDIEMLSVSGSNILKSESASQLTDTQPYAPLVIARHDSVCEEAEGYVNTVIDKAYDTVWGLQPWSTTINTTTPDFMHLAAATDMLEIDVKGLKMRSKSHYFPETPELQGE